VNSFMVTFSETKGRCSIMAFTGDHSIRRATK
jgi:hypothetical protein